MKDEKQTARRIKMPLRYLMNLVLVGLLFVGAFLC